MTDFEKKVEKKINEKKEKKTDIKNIKPSEKEDKKIKKNNKRFEVEKKKVEYIEKTLDFGIQKERKDAIKKILQIKNESLKKKLENKLIELLKDEPDSGVKINAIYMIGKLKATNGIPVIINKLDDEFEDVKIAAVYTLKTLNGISAKDKLIKMLEKQDMSKDSNLTESLILALGHFKAKEIIKLATDTINNNKTTKIIRGAFILYLGKTESKGPKEILLKLFKNPDEELSIRSYAVNSLAKLDIKEAAKDINEVLKTIDTYPFKKKNRYYSLKMYSISALVRLGDKQSIKRLINSLKSNNVGVRLKSIRLIKELKDKRTIDILKYKIKYDQSKKVRKAAKEALKEIEAAIEKEKNLQKSQKTKPQKNKKTGK